MNVRGILKGADNLRGIGAYKTDREVRLLFLKRAKKAALFQLVSKDGENFQESTPLEIRDKRDRQTDVSELSSIRVSSDQQKLISVYKFGSGITPSVYVGRGKGQNAFRTVSRIPQISETAQIVSGYKFKGLYVSYSGGENIRILTSANLQKWQISKKPVFTLNEQAAIEIGAVEKINSGILVIYFEAIPAGSGKFFYSINAAIFDDQNPHSLIIKSDQPIWEEPGEWNNLNINIRPFGLITLGEKLISYWQLEQNEIIAIIHEKRAKIHQESQKIVPAIHLIKHHENPIIEPIPGNFWESKATFNPAAVYDQGKVHIIYRAIGDHDMSMLGYAASRDGKHIDERLKDPIYIPTEPFEFSAKGGQTQQIPLSAYASGGGGYGGVEDPRLTKINGKMYMTYVAYDGAGPPRVALTSIALADFRNKNWKWKKPVIISKPNVVDKNAVIFPEKINGKYCILHRIYPDILIDFVDSLDFDGSTYLPGEYKISPRRLYWDSRKIGAGAPPILTDSGWLLIYQAVGNQDPGRYKIGALLLDKNDPTLVLARTDRPILEPEETYENEGLKYGVVYPCGAIVLNDELLVYYGGADMVTCLASAKLDLFLNDLKYHHVGTLKQVHI